MPAIVVRFPHHRVSTASLKRNTDELIRSLRDDAQPENTRKYSAGITPLARQLLTAGGPTPSLRATSLVPPNASMMASTDLSMPQYGSDCLNVSSVHCGAVDFNGYERINNEMDSKAIIGERIDTWLEATDRTAAEVCRAIEIEPNAFSQWRNGVHRLPLEVSDDLCRLFRLTLDWIYRGDLASLPDEELRKKINEVTKRRRRLLVS